LTGTIRYCSLNASRYCEQSRRDDLEAIAYVLLYLHLGVLPWQGLKIKDDDDRYKMIYLKKKETSLETLCKGLPREFIYFIDYCRKLKFDEEPNYNYLINLFASFLENKITFVDFDWNLGKNIKSDKNKKNSKVDLNKSYDMNQKNQAQKIT